MKRVIRRFYDIPIQACQAHKIATVDGYLLKYPRRESYRELKRITHSMIHADKSTFVWMLEEFRAKYTKDFEAKSLNVRTLKCRPTHPRLHYAYKTLIRDLDRLFVYHDFIQATGKEINTSN